MRSCFLRGCAVTAVLAIVLGAAFVIVVGPWPVYEAGAYLDADYYTDAAAAIDAAAAGEALTDVPGPLQAGWAAVTLTPEIGLPLGGYGARRGAASTGVHDDLRAKALALSDGADTVVLVSTDLVIVSPNLAELVRAQVAEQTPLTPNDIVFNATHTHSGPAGFVPGFAATLFGGAYVDGTPEYLAGRITQAIVEAHRDLAPALVAHGAAEAPEFIRNRTRDAAVDGFADVLAVKKADASRVLYCVRYSAHSTVIGPGNLEFARDYPGYVEDALTAQTGADAFFFGGAVGSMGARAPEGPDAFARAEAMGAGIAEKVAGVLDGLEYKDAVEIASIGVPVTAPPFQFRLLSPNWRLSPILVGQLGLSRDAWLHTVRIGDLFIAATPSDFSGELSLDLRAWADNHGYALWATSFNGAYVGYISPDRYYGDFYDEDGDVEYETGVMSWIGPDQEVMFVSLIKRSADLLAPEAME